MKTISINLSQVTKLNQFATSIAVLHTILVSMKKFLSMVYKLNERIFQSDKKMIRFFV